MLEILVSNSIDKKLKVDIVNAKVVYAVRDVKPSNITNVKVVYAIAQQSPVNITNVKIVYAVKG